MAKKERTQSKEQPQKKERSARHEFVRFCAFVALLFAAVFYLIGGILTRFFPVVGTVINFIASLTLLVSIAFPAWEFVRGRSRGWRIVYFVALIVYVLGAVFGLAFGI